MELSLSNVQEEEIDGVDFIIIASDGLWNVLSNKVSIFLHINQSALEWWNHLGRFIYLFILAILQNFW